MRIHSTSALGHVASVILLCSVGCSSDRTPEPETDGPATRAVTAAFYDGPAPDGAPLRLTERPRRVVAANSGALDFVLALVEPDRVAGLPRMALDYSSAAGRVEHWDEGIFFDHFTGEEILGQAPDLVVAHAHQSADTIALLQGRGVPVARLPDVAEFDDLIAIIEALAPILDADSRATALVQGLREREVRLREREKSAARTAISYTNYGSGGWAAGGETSADLLIRLAGLRNAGAADGRTGHFQIDSEQLLVRDPDILVIGSSVEGLVPTLDILRDDPILRELTAVRENRVVVLPARLFSTTSHHLVDAAERLADTVAHPDAPVDTEAQPSL